MVDLLSLQRDIHTRLSKIAPCFLRISLDDRALWVSDLPRKTAFSGDTAALPDGLCCFVDDASRLLCIDLSAETYGVLSDGFAGVMPSYPDNADDLPDYRLCRLLLSHPAPLSLQPMELNRRVLKLLFHPKLYKANETEAVYSQCAQLLRRKMPLPYFGGCLLAARLSQKGDFPCCLNT